MLTTELDLHWFPQLFDEYCEIVGAEYWVKPVERWLAHTKNNPYLRAHYEEQNRISFELAACSKIKHRHGLLPIEATHDPRFHGGLTFAAQSLSLYHALPQPIQQAFLGRIRGAFRDGRSMNGLLLEMSIATHFLKRGHRLSWPEFDDSVGNAPSFDLFVEDLGDRGLEVECKSVSNDKGRHLDDEVVATFMRTLEISLGFLRTLSCGLLIIITVPNRLPTSPIEQALLARDIARQVMSGKSGTRADGTQIEVRDFPASYAATIASLQGQEQREALEQLTRTRNVRHFVKPTRGRGLSVIAIQSMKRDTFLESAMRTTSDAATRQLSRTRAGLLVVGLEAVSGVELAALAEHDNGSGGVPSALQLRVSAFLSRPDMAHVIGVTFVSKKEVSDIGKELAIQGRSYTFFNTESPFWHPDFSGLFEPRGRTSKAQSDSAVH